MAYIYTITNVKNGKKYVGKTNYSQPEERFEEHKRESQKERSKNRPLYRAINKYGISNFKFETIEKTSIKDSYDREIYWIDKLQTYGSVGYNATKGGDGRSFLNRDQIIKDYNILNNAKKVAEKNNCDETSVRNILRGEGVIFNGAPNQKKIQACLKDKEYYFNSVTEAARWVIQNNLSGSIDVELVRKSISRVINGRRKTYLKMKWKEM